MIILDHHNGPIKFMLFIILSAGLFIIGQIQQSDLQTNNTPPPLMQKNSAQKSNMQNVDRLSTNSQAIHQGSLTPVKSTQSTNSNQFNGTATLKAYLNPETGTFTHGQDTPADIDQSQMMQKRSAGSAATSLHNMNFTNSIKDTTDTASPQTDELEIIEFNESLAIPAPSHLRSFLIATIPENSNEPIRLSHGTSLDGDLDIHEHSAVQAQVIVRQSSANDDQQSDAIP